MVTRSVLPLAAALLLGVSGAAFGFSASVGGTGSQATVRAANDALAKFRRGQVDAAIAEIDDVLHGGNLSGRESATLLYDRGMMYLQLRRTDKAIADFSNALCAEPHNRSAKLMLAKALFVSGEPEKGIDILAATVKSDPDDADAHLNLANAYHFRGDDDDALREYDAALDHGPSAYAYEGRALIELARGKAQDAERDLSKALALKPDYFDAYVNRGMAYANLGDGRLALADLDRAQKMAPDSIDVRIDRANVHALLGQADLAIADYDAAIAARPTDAALYRSRGDAYLSESDFARAIADYSAALDRAPNDATAHLDRGAAYYEQHRYDLAVADYRAAIALTPRDVRLYDNLGGAYAAQGKLDAAVIAYDEALKLKPDDRVALRERAGVMKARATGRAIVDDGRP